jgi:hypothetical protein
MEKKLKFEIVINASPQKVYEKLIDDRYYREWTMPFCPGSLYQGSWDRGAKILFLAPDKNGELQGMVSRIEENIPFKYISIQHLGMIKDGREILEGPEVDAWKGAHENYTLENEGGKTRFLVDMDSGFDMESFMLETWPKALNILKEICEQ